jgi:cardiolipin synthase A/B
MQNDGVLPFSRSCRAALVVSIIASSCSPSVVLQSSRDLFRSKKAEPVLEAPGGALSPERSEHVLEAMAREAGASDMLLDHLAVEEAHTGSPLVLGNRATLLRDGPEAYREMERAMREARHHVNVEVYTFADDAVGREFANLMMQRAKEGIAVQLIYDSVGCLATNPAFFDEMRRGGVRVVEYNPVAPVDARGQWQLEQRDHRKLLIVDNRIAFTGGMNISTEYSGTNWSGSSSSSRHGLLSSLRSAGSRGRSPSSDTAADRAAPGSASAEAHWRDTHVAIEGPVVAEFQKLFRETWEKQHGAALPWDDFLGPAATVGRDIVRAIGTTPDDNVSLIHTTMLSAIEHANRSIWITQAYFAPDETLVKAIERAARRGVDTRILLPGTSDFWMILYAGRARFAELLDAGVRIYERQGPMLHAKTAVIDGVWSTVGSANLDYRSLVKNDEVNAVILGESFASQLEAMFRDDLAASDEITKKKWKRRSVGARLKEATARLWTRWL